MQRKPQTKVVGFLHQLVVDAIRERAQWRIGWVKARSRGWCPEIPHIGRRGGFINIGLSCQWTGACTLHGDMAAKQAKVELSPNRPARDEEVRNDW